MSISAALADIAPSRITRVGIDTVRSVRRRRAPDGSPPASASSSTCPTCMSSSRCRTRCCRWCIATPHSCTPGSFRRVRPRCERSPPIRVTWVRRSASSAFSTPGARRWSGIRMCIASCRPAACRPITSGGFGPSTLASSSPITVLSRVFRGKFVAALRRAYARGDLDLAGAPRPARSGAVAHLRRWALRDRLDRLRETGLRWGVSGAAVPGALHPSGRHQQPSLDRLRRRACDLSVEGLRARQSVAHDDAHRDGVSPALRPARTATWLRPYSPVWLSRQRLSHRASRARSAPPPTGSATRGDLLDTAGLALSAMWSADGHRPDPLRAPADHRHPRLRHLMSVRHVLTGVCATWSPTCQERCASIRCPQPVASAAAPVARRPACVPPPLARRRPLDRRRLTLHDPDSSSIAGRRASGFLQVSLSKVPRHQIEPRPSLLRRGTSDER